jgi:NADH-quinone oxidoreductase subunit G
LDVAGRAPAPAPNGALRLGTFRSIWAAPEVEVSPALKFLVPRQSAELHPADAKRLGLANGDRVEVSGDGTTIGAVVALRTSVPAGSVFLQEGTVADSANALTTPLVRLVKRNGAGAAR